MTNPHAERLKDIAAFLFLGGAVAVSLTEAAAEIERIEAECIRLDHRLVNAVADRDRLREALVAMNEHYSAGKPMDGCPCLQCNASRLAKSALEMSDYFVDGNNMVGGSDV